MSKLSGLRCDVCGTQVIGRYNEPHDIKPEDRPWARVMVESFEEGVDKKEVHLCPRCMEVLFEKFTCLNPKPTKPA